MFKACGTSSLKMQCGLSWGVWVWCFVSRRVVRAQTIHEAPPGQKPKIVAFVAAAVPQLLSARVAIAPAFSALLCGCLEGLRIDLTTSAAVASALELLISQSLAPPLRDKLWRVGHHWSHLQAIMANRNFHHISSYTWTRCNQYEADGSVEHPSYWFTM